MGPKDLKSAMQAGLKQVSLVVPILRWDIIYEVIHAYSRMSTFSMTGKLSYCRHRDATLVSIAVHFSYNEDNLCRIFCTDRVLLSK